MTHQSVILLATLLVMAAFSTGYGLAWFCEEAAPYVAIAFGVLLSLYGMFRIERDMRSIIGLATAEGLVVPGFDDTEPLE
jgi:hypothetical protein